MKYLTCSVFRPLRNLIWSLIGRQQSSIVKFGRISRLSYLKYLITTFRFRHCLTKFSVTSKCKEVKNLFVSILVCVLGGGRKGRCEELLILIRIINRQEMNYVFQVAETRLHS